MNKILLFSFILMNIFFTDKQYKAESGKDVFSLQMVYITGQSPKIFDKGWVFGVKCLKNPGSESEHDVSSNVRWSGTGLFNPECGNLTRPVFNSLGKNEIILTCEVDGHKIMKTFTFETVNSDDYAAFGDEVYCSSDTHGCPSCPHQVKGYISSGSSTVFVDEKPAARVGDGGTHMTCCDLNRFTIITGDENVLIDGYPAARLGDKTEHCGGHGSIVKLFR